MEYVMNKQALMNKLGFDEEDLIMLFEVFIKSSKDNIEKLRVAIESNDYNTIYICAHSLKGSSGNMMLDEVYDITKELESASKDKIIIEYKSYYEKLHNIFQNLKLK